MLMADVNTTTIGRVFSAKGSAEERAEMVQEQRLTAPSRVMRSASHFGTWPPCSGRSALPDLRAINVLP